mgnify:CR=1 FL=1
MMIFVPWCLALKRFFPLPPVIFSTKSKKFWSNPLSIIVSKSNLLSSLTTERMKIVPLGDFSRSKASIACKTEGVLLKRWMFAGFWGFAADGAGVVGFIWGSESVGRGESEDVESEFWSFMAGMAEAEEAGTREASGMRAGSCSSVCERKKILCPTNSSKNSYQLVNFTSSA